MLHPGARSPRVGVIQNALDCYTDLTRRRVELAREFGELASIGLSPEELDLRMYFGKQDKLRQQIAELGYLWVVGGNTFVLRKAFAQCGFDSIIQDLCRREDFIYAGYSAGVCVLGPTLHGIHLADDPDAVATGYAEGIIWEGLKLLPYCIAPHYKSDHHETELIDLSVAYYIDHKIPFVALRDGEALVLDTNEL